VSLTKSNPNYVTSLSMSCFYCSQEREKLFCLLNIVQMRSGKIETIRKLATTCFFDINLQVI
jgi:hypothetical protein